MICRALALAFTSTVFLSTAFPAPVLLKPKEFKKGTSPMGLWRNLSLRITKQAEKKLWILTDRLEGTAFNLRTIPIEEPGFEAVVLGRINYEHRKLEIPDKREGYLLEVTPKGCALLGKDSLGIQWGLLTLTRIINLKKGFIPSLYIRDWPDVPWRGIVIELPRSSRFDAFLDIFEKYILPYRVNTVVLKVNYNFQFQSHPEVRDERPRTPDFAKRLKARLDRAEIRCIPHFNCIGHQSKGKKKLPLLESHPELGETPGLDLDDPQLTWRSWCPRHPKLNPLLFDLWDEIVDAFQGNYFHIGANEVLLIAEETCPRCKNLSAGDVFSEAVKQYHAYFRGKGNTVLMWGDRLVNAADFDYSKYEGSYLNTYKAIHYLPRDIIICDWHREVKEVYPSIEFFQKQGFRTLACPGANQKTVKNMWRSATKHRTSRFLGFLATPALSFKQLAAGLLRKGAEETEQAAAALELLARLAWEGKSR